MLSESLKSIFTKSVLSGILIGIGCTVYLCVENKYIGALLFSFGLFTIIQLGFSLYTGKVGYIPDNKPSYILNVLVTFLGNAAGTALSALLISLTRMGDIVAENALSAMNTKTGDSFAGRLILGVFCGILMFIAVENARMCREKKLDFSAVFGISFPVMIFIFCGFNHSVADCFYIFISGATAESLLYILTVAVGNALGGMLIPAARKLFDKTE